MEAEAGARYGTPPDTGKNDRVDECWPDRRGQAAPDRTPEELHTEPLSEGVHLESENTEWHPAQKSSEA